MLKVMNGAIHVTYRYGFLYLLPIPYHVAEANLAAHDHQSFSPTSSQTKYYQVNTRASTLIAVGHNTEQLNPPQR